uniref:Uncharacterized protein n=1 Tax=Pelagomonas calceolata TaxID=35677 RepID=A0A7S4E3L3_9STRA
MIMPLPWRRQLLRRTYEEAEARVAADKSLVFLDVYNSLALANGLMDAAINARHGVVFEERHLRVLRGRWRFHRLLDDGGASCPEAMVLWPTTLTELFKNESFIEGMERYVGAARLGFIKTLIGNATRLRAAAERACVPPSASLPCLVGVVKGLGKGPRPKLVSFLAHLEDALKAGKALLNDMEDED